MPSLLLRLPVAIFLTTTSNGMIEHFLTSCSVGLMLSTKAVSMPFSFKSLKIAV